MILDLPPELLPSVYQYLSGDDLWHNLRPVCRRLNASIGRSQYWLQRANDLYGVVLPDRMRAPQPKPEASGSSTGEAPDVTGETQSTTKEKMTPIFRCMAAERAHRRWSHPVHGLSHLAANQEAHVGTIDALRLFRCPSTQKLLALSGSRDRQIALWDLSSISHDNPPKNNWDCERIDQAHTGWIWCISVAPSRHQFYSAGWDSLVQQWQIAEGRIERGVHLDFDEVAALSCLSDGPHLLYTSTWRGGPFLFDLRVGTAPQRQLHCHQRSAVIEMATGPDCELLYSIGEDGRLVAVDKRKFQMLFELRVPSLSHVDYADGQLCVSTRTGQVWSLEPSTLQRETTIDCNAGLGDDVPPTWGHHAIRVTRGATVSGFDNIVRLYTPGVRPRLVASTETMGNVTSLDVSDGAMVAALGMGSMVYWLRRRQEDGFSCY